MKKILSLLFGLSLSAILSVGTVFSMTYTLDGNLTKIAIPQQGYEGNTIKWCDKCEPVKISPSSEGCYAVTLGGVSYIECAKIFDDSGKSLVESSSGKGNSNDLSVFVVNKDPEVKDWIELKINVVKDYYGRVDFSKIQRYDGSSWEDISLSSKYVSDYSDELGQGYVKFTTSDKGKIELSKFIKFAQTGSYRIYVEDKDGFKDYAQFNIGKISDASGNKTTSKTEEKKDIEEEIYTSRSCKKYIIRYYEEIDAFSSPNLNKKEYFVNKDYFKRYIDSKNKQVEGCPRNEGWITTSYKDKSNSSDRYVASNGKVYSLEGKEGKYYSSELNDELKTPTYFKTLQELRYYIRDRNFLTSMVY